MSEIPNGPENGPERRSPEQVAIDKLKAAINQNSKDLMIDNVHTLLIRRTEEYKTTYPDLAKQMAQIARDTRPYDRVLGYDQETQVDEAFVTGQMVALIIAEKEMGLDGNSTVYRTLLAKLALMHRLAINEAEGDKGELGRHLRELGGQGLADYDEAEPALEYIEEKECTKVEEGPYLKSGFGFMMIAFFEVLSAIEEQSQLLKYSELQKAAEAAHDTDWDAALKDLLGQ